MENHCLQVNSVVIKGTLTIEHLLDNGTPSRKSTHPNAEATLCRNEFRDVLLQAHLGTRSAVYPLRNAKIHKRFVKEGKMSIVLAEQKVNLYFSNCPSNKLSTFVKFLSAKGTNPDQTVGARERLLSDKPKGIQEISPLMLRCPNTGQSLLSQKRALAETSSTTPAKKRIEVTDVAMPSRTLNPIQLTAEQKAVVSAVMAGRNVFFTGSAGTGKSYLLRHLLSSLPPQDTFATATTGVAAAQIGGTTLHAFAGVGTGTATVEQMVERAKRPPWVAQWRRCSVLVVDEVSMLDGRFFQKLERVARLVRRSDRPFGGIKLVLCGDFLQLPPISRKGDPAPVFCFQTAAWRQCVQMSLELRQVHRQRDPKFVELLQEVRHGRCPEWVEEILVRTADNCLNTGGVVATRLSTHNDDVDFMNKHRYDALLSQEHVFVATDSAGAPSDLLDACAPSTLRLKVGAQVMLTKNTKLRAGLANGSRGVVVGFETTSGNPVVEFAKGGGRQVVGKERWSVRTGPERTCHSRRQLPLRLAWAMSIHKSQGLTLDFAELSLGRTFEAGQAYVALSRAASLQGLKVLDFSKACVRADAQVLAFYQRLEDS
ncbi:hypothetical protein HPB47_001921 [Ixodes persulcatus]|uniref:Uncharacterized protein n=1 Tax=Ixodes persulcatus TaxID=34615 RepID=A0AC60PPA2_IXOPE|nr:hypothetical protein HPB47_001921 [Ixodes persulcatus]